MLYVINRIITWRIGGKGFEPTGRVNLRPPLSDLARMAMSIGKSNEQYPPHNSGCRQQFENGGHILRIPRQSGR
jgi:hypothetical protein